MAEAAAIPPTPHDPLRDSTGAPLRHVAIIMDGNGRWAAARGLPRGEGHRRGVEALRRTVRAAGEFGIGILTIFSFSSENWSRPATEICDLLGLLRRFIRNDLAELHRSNVRVRVIGEREGLDPDIRGLLEEAEDLTRRNDGLLSGRRLQLRRAARRSPMRRDAWLNWSRRAKLRTSDITPELLGQHLDAPDMPDPDLHHSHQRRAAAVEFPAVAVGL